MVKKDFFSALEQLESERNISKEYFINVLTSALALAYKKKTGINKGIELKLNPDQNKIRVFAYQTVTEEADPKEPQISLADARLINKKYRIGDVIKEEISSTDFARVIAQTAKQVVMQKIHEEEGKLAYNELSQKEGQIITTVVRKIDGKNIYVDINKFEAVLLIHDQIPNDNYAVGDKIKVYVKKIKITNRGPQILISRSVPAFVKKLLELEIPEIASGAIIIKGIVREAGNRTKVAVYTEDKDIDAVGACVGNRGFRIHSIISELNGEKIDIIKWSSDILEYIAYSLSPAKVAIVEVNDDNKTAKAVVNDQELSAAIGKDGQNVRLAAKLTGWKIDVCSFSSVMSEKGDENNDEVIDETLASEEDLFDEDLGDLNDK